MDRQDWEKHIHEEVAFWDEWLGTQGGSWPEDFQSRVDPKQRLPVLIENTLLNKGVAPGSSIRILDLGSGPLTSVGVASDHYDVSVTPVDPLADHYRSLLEKYRIAAPVLPQLGEAEKLDCLFPPQAFDVVWARNSLDHSYDPLMCIFQAIQGIEDGRDDDHRLPPQ
ncbi:MAG: class I SAM-dependent methyltransferase [Anderseniella sp.]|nr:class I SAM-dependent methyltransferase [Anderseniella sp.]